MDVSSLHRLTIIKSALISLMLVFRHANKSLIIFPVNMMIPDRVASIQLLILMDVQPLVLMRPLAYN